MKWQWFKFLPKQQRTSVQQNLAIYSLLTNHRAADQSNQMWCILLIERSVSGQIRSSYQETLHRGAFCQFPFRWIYYYGSNKSTGKEIGKTHLSALKKFKQSKLQCQVRKLWSDYTLCPPVVLLSRANFVTQNIRYFPVGVASSAL